MRGETDIIFQYWGKAQPAEGADAPCHLLPFHCLDVASVAAAWWEESAVVRRLLIGDSPNPGVVRAWVLFFVALHDLGKFDIRFQLKAPEALHYLRPGFDPESAEPEDYAHGPMACGWLVQTGFLDEERYDFWQPWIEAVAGHHGDLSGDTTSSPPDADEDVIALDSEARWRWLGQLSALFLKPVGCSLEDDPPACPEALAGFCAVADWVGSNPDWFPYRDQAVPLHTYWDEIQERGRQALVQTGILGEPAERGGMETVFPHLSSRQIQCLAESIPAEPGLLLAEAPTGSGKTEFALAYASRLLASGAAESVIFALPTQATANAMLARLEEAAPKLFRSQGNVVLAHGRARYHRGYAELREAGRRRTAQGREDAAVQCAEWLAQSRKRVFLGQIGVCTIDQVLVSVLSVRHQFVRAFGLRRAVLIVDEVHAYDAYMYGLLTRVLDAQARAGGSAVLMSATLPTHQRDRLLQAWGADKPERQSSAYPLVTWGPRSGPSCYWSLDDRSSDQPPARTVDLERWPRAELRPTDEDLNRIAAAAASGARVAVICNLVAEAQLLWRRLRAIAAVPVDLFHARFVFGDRERIEQRILDEYGSGPRTGGGRILVATQVVEQSLDLDFDWLVTQLCPVDLLFQRMGRLHRHERDRPAGFAQPLCTVLVPEFRDYGMHEVVYSHRRVLWRTQRLLEGVDTVTFPGAYREWIESVYDETAWTDEPDDVIRSWETFDELAQGKYLGARQLAEADMVPLPDTEAGAARLTRDGDNALPVLLIQRTARGLAYLDGRLMDALDEFECREAEDLTTVNVPRGWKRVLGEPDEAGRYHLELSVSVEGEWLGAGVAYHRESGLEKTDEPA